MGPAAAWKAMRKPLGVTSRRMRATWRRPSRRCQVGKWVRGGGDQEEAQNEGEGAGEDVGVEGPLVGAEEVGGSAVEEVGGEVGRDVVGVVGDDAGGDLEDQEGGEEGQEALGCGGVVRAHDA